MSLSLDRVLFYLHRLHRIGIWLGKDFDKASIDDLKKLVAERIENGCVESTGKPFTDYTKWDFKRALRTFYKWLYGIPWTKDEYPEIVGWISLRMPNGSHKLPEDLLTVNDVKRMVAAATNLRDKALIMTLYEGGFRIGELLNMRVKDLQFNEYGVAATVNGKTGMRRVLLIASAPLLANWLENHPNKGDRDSYLWISLCTNNFRKDLKYSGIAKRIKEIARLAGVKKRVNPHNFRHSRASELANKLTEPQMCKYFGWSIGSKMPAVYVHLSGRDIDDAILKIHGLKSNGNGSESLTTVKCPRCSRANSSANKYCSACGLLLDEKEAVELVTVGDKTVPLGLVKEMIKAEFERMKKEYLKEK